jgi:hypothetical protein
LHVYPACPRKLSLPVELACWHCLLTLPVDIACWDSTWWYCLLRFYMMTTPVQLWPHLEPSKAHTCKSPEINGSTYFDGAQSPDRVFVVATDSHINCLLRPYGQTL